MVEVGTGTASSKFLKRNYPIEEGLTAGIEKQEGRKIELEAEFSNILNEDKKGLR